MKLWPALALERADDLVLAAIDDFCPTASEELDAGVRVFFASHEQRDRAHGALRERGVAAAAIEVSDEDWAVRSQQDLRPITVGGITIIPSRAEPPDGGSLRRAGGESNSNSPITIVIEPSMGFGTGHHATTRLCLAALQRTTVAGTRVLDVGTGSGILAIAAARLGAAQAAGIDCDADAIQSANENLARNPWCGTVRFGLAEIAPGLPRADIVLANLTGALLIRVAPTLLGALSPGGTLIVSGILAVEEDQVLRAFSTVDAVWREQEDEWVGLMFQVPHGTV
ncbi:MAG: 50S ribosomal protein L11 methyltransferase [Acidobacteriota bacterium]